MSGHAKELEEMQESLKVPYLPEVTADLSDWPYCYSYIPEDSDLATLLAISRYPG